MTPCIARVRRLITRLLIASLTTIAIVVALQVTLLNRGNLDRSTPIVTSTIPNLYRVS